MSSPYDRNPPKARTGYEKDERYEPRPAAETAEAAETADAKAEEAAVAAPAPAEAAAAPASKPATPDELQMPVDLDRLLGGIGEEPTLPAVAAEAPVSAPAAAAVPVAAGPGPKLATPDELGMPVNLDALLGGIGEAAPPGPVAALAPAAPVPPVAEPAAPAPPPKLATPDDLGMPVNLDALLGGIGEEK
ncbi:hypothetical protein L6V77_15275 [Myxococcota bacterium]|nr:hypothetical protein [Myxococcota bacterium]